MTFIFKKDDLYVKRFPPLETTKKVEEAAVYMPGAEMTMTANVLSSWKVEEINLANRYEQPGTRSAESGIRANSYGSESKGATSSKKK